VRNLAGKTAVVTGAASGIGYGLARHALELGMRVVMADIEEETLARAASDAEAVFGDAVTSLQTDVSEPEDWLRLKTESERRFGPVEVLFNNAGVTLPPRRTWELSTEDWRWLLDVNLWGVIYGLHTFLPEMVDRDSGYVVNTASMAGLLPSDSMAPYAATKHAVVGLSETLFRDLESQGSRAHVSVLCAGPVATQIFDAERNRQPRYGASLVAKQAVLPGALPLQMEPTDVARVVFDAIGEDRFWILTHPQLYGIAIRQRGDSVAAEENPSQRTADPWVARLQ
jgi:NAD(P)-dependent dehydrogenase (short-subunit alcohol dehydrogenase family)